MSRLERGRLISLLAAAFEEIGDEEGILASIALRGVSVAVADGSIDRLEALVTAFRRGEYPGLLQDWKARN